MRVSEYIRSLQPYPPGKPIEETQREYGIKDVYKLASNENPLGPSPRALLAMKSFLPNLHRYPDGACFELRKKMAEHLGVPSDWLLFGNGSDEIVEFLVRTFCDPGDRILTSQYAFVTYRLSAQAHRCETIEVPVSADFRLDLKALKAAWTPRHKIIFIVNPNNPTGAYVNRVELNEFMAFFGGRDDVVVVFDEAYFEFARAEDYPNALDDVRRYSNVVTLRTLSKAYGLAGLRLGTCIAHPEIISLLNRVRKPFNVNALMQHAAIAALGDVEHLKRSQELTWRGLDYFYAELTRIGIPFFKSQGNFVLIDTKRDSIAVYEALLRQGVILRPVKNYGLPTQLRMSVGLPHENRKAIEALEEILGENLVTKRPFVITIDGPAGSGKSTVSSELALRLGFTSLTTGAFYRGLGALVVKNGVDPSDQERVVDLARSGAVNIVADAHGTKVFIDNLDVTESLNGEKVGETASKVSAIPEVRAALMAPQRAFGTGTAKGLVAEGRDCGTVVFPQADVKIFLTASLDARAQRRTSETAGASVQESQSKIQTRDHADSSRKVAPMAKASDAVEIDTSHLSVAEVVDKILELIQQKNGGKVP